MVPPDLSQRAEAVLFAAGEPVAVKHLARVLETPEAEIAGALDALAARLENGSGLRLVRANGAAELVTAPVVSSSVEAHLKSERQGALSRAALEVLAVIAYRGPVTRSEIEAIRGVNCSFTLRNLLLRGLIEREEHTGRGYLYRVTFDFLKHLGLSQASDLPDFVALSRDERAQAALAASAAADARPLDSATPS